MIKRLVFIFIGSLFFLSLQVILNLLYLDDLSSLIIEFAILVLMAFLCIKVIGFMTKKEQINDFKDAKKEKQRKNNLFTWLGIDINTDQIIFDIIGYQIDYIDNIKNLKVFKQKIIESIGDDVNDYVLLKEVIKIHSDKSFLKILTEVSKPFFIAMLTAIMTTLFISKVPKLIEEWDIYIFVSFIIKICMVLFYSLFVLAIVYNSFKSGQKRALVFITILDIIIDEKK